MKKLRIALIVDHINYFAWQDAIVKDLKDSKSVEIVLKIDLDEDIKKAKKSKKKLPLLWKLFLKIDSKIFKPNPNATAILDNDITLNNIPSYQITDSFIASDLDTYNLDIILNLTETNFNLKIQDAAKYGIWFLNHCDLDGINKRPYGIWEMLDQKPEVAGVLRYLKSGMSSPKTIDLTFSCKDGLSYKRNLNEILWQTHFLIKNNVELLATNEELFNKKLDSKSHIYESKAINVPLLPPSNLKILSFVLKLYKNKILQLIKSQFYFDQWALIFFNNKNANDPFNLKSYTKILPPKDRFWADPFLIKHNDKTYLFIEELIYKNKLGHLAVMEIDEQGNYTKPETILVKDYHLSYPFVFEDNGSYYMIPETSGNNDIQLYKATDFPLKWEFQQVLMKDVIAVDTTIYKENDTYWMFTNMKKHKGASKHVELFLYSSKSLYTDQWIEHPLNPIVTDIKTARPAGKLFNYNGKLYRPSQNCSNHYGYGLNISEITALNTNKFEEDLIFAIKPDWDKAINCTHSFNSAEQLYISDIKIKRKRF
ncbi:MULTISPECIES: hypothetical protein [unclassified Winogradskyella]|uniref:glucosamine inositolphosphorylceramide transferase family protein n=1 Tax=unclassified Winogradskyella TaxID=2615021 RepID=UPI002FF272A3